MEPTSFPLLGMITLLRFLDEFRRSGRAGFVLALWADPGVKSLSWECIR
jgi:hypothetical protein